METFKRLVTLVMMTTTTRANALDIAIDWITTQYEPMTAQVGDTVTFTYQPFHNVYIHPSGDCSELGAIEVGGVQDFFVSPVSYAFEEPGSVTFACDVGEHCESGEIITFTVTTPEEPVNPIETMLPSSEPTAVGGDASMEPTVADGGATAEPTTMTDPDDTEGDVVATGEPTMVGDDATDPPVPVPVQPLPADNFGTVPNPNPDVTAIDYDDNGWALQGFKSVPTDVTAFSVPALVIIPDWDGVNMYEKQRADLVATDLGYVGFAADIYGADLHEVPNITERRALADQYRANPSLFASRIQAAVDLVRTFPEVDSNAVGVAGYCFGGSGVLIYGLGGYSDVQAIVSFHGGLSPVLEQNSTANVTGKVLVLSGGDDDTSTDVMTLEVTLDDANADWEITRYSDIEHAFTKWDDDRYNALVDARSWDSMKTFLHEAFGEVPFESSPPDMVKVEAVPYTDVDGTELQGYVSMPSNAWERPLPIVVILPDWDGVNEYENQRATMLAEEGYIAFSADIYGANLQSGLDMDTRIELVTRYRSNRTLYVQRIERAIAEAKTMEGAKDDEIAVIGYCFGGTGAIDLAFSGNDEVELVVAFHGGLVGLDAPVPDVYPYVLVLSGGDDDAHGNQTKLEAALNAGEADWEITRYSGVDHGFTSWSSSAHSLKADVRSWYSMMTAMHEVMPIPAKAGNGSTATNGDLDHDMDADDHDYDHGHGDHGDDMDKDHDDEDKGDEEDHMDHDHDDEDHMDHDDEDGATQTNGGGGNDEGPVVSDNATSDGAIGRPKLWAWILLLIPFCSTSILSLR